MDEGPSTWTVVALLLALASMALAVVAYRRSGGRHRLERARTKPRRLADEVAWRMRHGLEDSWTRARHAQRRLAELRSEAAADVRGSMDALARELAEVRREIELAIEHLEVELTPGAEAEQEALARHVHHIEGTLHVLAARAEIHTAELLAGKSRFVEAEDLLEDAVARVREAKMRLAEEETDEPAFGPVLEALHEVLRAVRARVRDHKLQSDTALAASDSLLASLHTHGRPATGERAVKP